MFNSAKDELLKEAIKFERIRTILALSHQLKRPICILICKYNQTPSEGTLLYGVVDWLGFNGNNDNPLHKRYLTGGFTIMLDSSGEESAQYLLTDVSKISLDSHSSIDSILNSQSTLNLIQHLRPFVGFNFNDPDSTSDESYYYTFISKMMS